MKTSILLAGSVMGIALAQGDPSQAAEFNFGGGNGLRGFLRFQGSPLTGIGLETVESSQLQNSSFSYIFLGEPTIGPTTQSLLFGGGSATFQFIDGELRGITSSSSRSTSGFFAPGGVGGGGVSVSGVYSLLLQGSSYQQRFTGSVVSGGLVNGQMVTIRRDYNDTITASGGLGFQTISRVEAVPEPTTCLGLGAATGLAAWLKRRTRSVRF